MSKTTAQMIFCDGSWLDVRTREQWGDGPSCIEREDLKRLAHAAGFDGLQCEAISVQSDRYQTQQLAEHVFMMSSNFEMLIGRQISEHHWDYADPIAVIRGRFEKTVDYSAN